MKRLLPLITLCSFLAFFSSCGQKGSTTNANVTIVAGGFTGAIPGQTGGTMLLGYSPSLGASFSKVFDGTPMELDNGRWDFAAISWSGNGAGDILQGQVRCAISRGNNLTGGEANVALSLSTANCADPLFGAKNTKNAGGEPLPLIPTVCAGPEGLRESDPTACKNSTPLSYRVIFPGKDLGGSPRPGLVSTCVAEESPQDTAPMENINEQIKIPLVLPGPWNFPVIIELYDDATCSTGLDRVVVFNVYTGEANRGQAELDDQGAYAGTKNEIKITKNPCSSLAGLQSTPFALSTSPLTYAICTPEQFIGILSAPNDNYELYGDLDFTSYGDFADPVIDGDFTGQFDGRGRTIRNVSFDQTTTNATGLFRQIDGTGTFNDGQANVKNLTLEGFTISSSGNSNGALAGNILIGSEVRNIRLNNITLNLNATTSSHGALAGSLTNVAGTGNGGGNSRVNRIYANNIQINTTANASKIGGLIGSVDGNGNGVELSESLVKGVTIRTNTSTPTIIGGVVGEQIASSSIKDVTATGVSIGV